ncbi:PDDEXK nuclease domain-containing protein [Promicromonospora sp. NPDC019610]|uniref:PDDEXK nuclease domain-containing protein n=1 Tax=Promicromonospora sp. NPDC019610 TaxID=3364405 RepID=UPI0037AB21B7
MNMFRRTESGPEGFEDIIDEITESIRRTFTGIVVDHLEDLLALPDRHMCVVDRHMELMEDERDYSVDLLLFHVTQLRYIAIQVHVGRFNPVLIGRTRYTVSLVDDLVRIPETHRPTVGILLCTDAPADQMAGPVAVALYDDLSPAEQSGLPLPLELTALVDRCLDTTTAKHAVS